MKKFTILLVDDIENNIESLKLIINDSFDDINLLTALSAKDAIMQIMKNDIDLILSDIQMPEINGLELVEYLHSIEQTKDIPIILITGIYNSVENMKKGFSVGAVDYIAKPIDDELLCSKLKVYIQIYQQQKEKQVLIEEKENLLQQQLKINYMIDQFENLPKSTKNSLGNLEEYSDLIQSEDLLDISKILEKEKDENGKV